VVVLGNTRVIGTTLKSIPALEAMVTKVTIADKLDALALFAQRGVFAVGILRAIVTAQNELRRLGNAFAVQAPQMIPAENALVVARSTLADAPPLAIPSLAVELSMALWEVVLALFAS
jgi:hypothetical protein